MAVLCLQGTSQSENDMLTSKQKELLIFIHERVSQTGVSPSFDEMKEALDLKSKSGIHRLITALEERGFIRRLPHRARALEILKLPDAVSSKSEEASNSNVIEANFSKPKSNVSNPLPAYNESQSVSIPMMGRIAAGVPIEAIQDHSHDIDVPIDLLSKGEHYALEVKGDSMIDAGIMEGDTVLIRKCSTADNGEIVVALVEDEEATLKRLRKKGNTVALEAANPAYETRIFGADQVKVQGKLVGLIRRY